MPQDIIGNKDGTDFFVGSNAPNPAPAPTPVTRYTTPTPTPTTPTDAAATLSKPTLGTVDENAIREQVRQRMQSSIDAINANYANLISQDKIQGQERTGETRAMNARGGLIGSDFGASAAAKTDQTNAQSQKALVDQQNAQIVAVQQNIEDRASQEIASKKNEALQTYQLDTASYDKAQAAARDDLKTLASKGVDINTLAPAQKAALLKQAGYEEGMGELVYNAMKPKPQQIDYKFEKLNDGTALFYGTDPETGELKTQKLNIDIPPNYEPIMAPNGTLIGFDKNANKAIVLSGQGQFAKPGDALDGALKQAQIDEIRSKLGVASANSPEVSAWVQNIKNTTAKFSDVPDNMKNAVALGLSTQAGSTNVQDILSTTQKSIQELQDMVDKNKGFAGAVGAKGLSSFFGLKGSPIAGTQAANFDAKLKQVTNDIVLPNLTLLHGLGRVTDREFQALTHAVTSLNTNLSEDAFKTELKNITDRINQKVQESQSSTSGGQIIEYQGHRYQADPQGNFDPNSPLTDAGSGATNALGFIGPVKLGSHLAQVNNNPGNLRYVGQSGASQGQGGFASFSTPQAGAKALASQIQLDASRGHTLASFINKYAPPSENDTNTYLTQAVQALGVSPTTKLSNVDLKKLLAFMARKESNSVIQFA